MFNAPQPPRHPDKLQGSWDRFTSHIQESAGVQAAATIMRSLTATAKQAARAESELRFTDVVDLWQSQVQQNSNPSTPAERAVLALSSLELGKALLKSGDYVRGTEMIDRTIESAISSGIRIPSDVILGGIRSSIDAHLAHRSLEAVVRNLKTAFAITSEAHGPLSAQSAELAFERVLALEALRATDDAFAPDRYGELSDAITHARELVSSPECGLSSARKGALLFALGKRQFSYSDWDESVRTLRTGLGFLTETSKITETILMLAQVAAYQQRPVDAQRHLAFIEKDTRMCTPQVLRAIQEVRAIIIPTKVEAGISRGHNPSDPPQLKAIKDLLVLGYTLLQAEKPMAAQSVLEGAQAHISRFYHERHVLWAKANILLAKAFADQAPMCENAGRDSTELLLEGRRQALAGLDLMRHHNLDSEQRRTALTMALEISEALDDMAQMHALQERLNTGDF